jgi:outer membrane protein OmpA-like peptidoglycan-associated protein
MTNYVTNRQPGGSRSSGLRAATALGLFLAGAMLPAAAMAQEFLTDGKDADTVNVPGPYIGLGAGLNVMNNEHYSGVPYNNGVDYQRGMVGLFTGGYKFGYGFRAELEGGYRANDAHNSFGTSGHGTPDATTVMINGLYDFDTGGAITPYLGGGIGLAYVDRTRTGSPFPGGTEVSGAVTDWAYQLIGGVSYALNRNMKADLSYHYLSSFDPETYGVRGAAFTTVGKSDYESHAVIAALRWEFGDAPAPAAAPPPPPPPRPAPPPPPPAPVVAPAPQTQEFIIYFAFDSAVLDEPAKAIVRQVIQYNQTHPNVRIALAGHTDLAGSPDYNVRLSLRRADAVRAELVNQGVSVERISVTALGESQPAVPTAPGVREPLNRRVVVDLR